MRILILVHPDLVPPKDIDVEALDWAKVPWTAEFDVWQALSALGHKCKVYGAAFDLPALKQVIDDFRPNLVFNLLEEFMGEAVFDSNIVAYLELLGVPYTGCNPKGLILARDKALSKKILSYHRIAVPDFQVFRRNRPKAKLKLKRFPVIVKSLNEEASTGISQASVVHTEEKLRERVAFIFEKFHTDAIAERFIEGKEYYVAVFGNYKIKVLPARELKFEKVKKAQRAFYTSKAKYDEEYREKKGISTGAAELSSEELEKITRVARRAYKALDLNGYARMDLRMEKNGKVFFLEANPNPDISMYEDFSESARSEGLEYEDLIAKIVSLGKRWAPENA